jgi:hypothetical protein
MKMTPMEPDDMPVLRGRPEVATQSIQGRCFVASSFGNKHQVVDAVQRLRRDGWFVYDFTAAELSVSERDWGGLSYAAARAHPEIQSVANSDLLMLRCLGAADVMLVILPAGFSAGWEAGYATARGARVVVCGDLRQLDVPILHADFVSASIGHVPLRAPALTGPGKRIARAQFEAPSSPAPVLSRPPRQGPLFRGLST